MGLRKAGSKALSRLHVCMKQLITSMARVLLGFFPRPHHREDLVLPLSPHAPAVSDFLVGTMTSALSAGIREAKHVGGELDHGLAIKGKRDIETNSSPCSSTLLKRMEESVTPLNLLLEACIFILNSALEMAGGQRLQNVSDSARTVAMAEVFQNSFDFGVEESKGGTSSDDWEAFNRRMDARDRALASRIAAVTGTGGGGETDSVTATEEELMVPHTVIEALKVSLTLMRRLSSHSLIMSSPFTSAMQLAARQVCFREGMCWAEGNVVEGGREGEGELLTRVAGAEAAVALGTTEQEMSEQSSNTLTVGSGRGNMEVADAPTIRAASVDGEDQSGPTAVRTEEQINAVGGSGVGGAASSLAPSWIRNVYDPGSELGDAGSGTALGKGKGKASSTQTEAFSSDLFVRRIHLRLGYVLEPVWSDPRLSALPQDTTSRLLGTVLELMQSLQMESSFDVLMRQRQRAAARTGERGGGGGGRGVGGSGPGGAGGTG
ncbi:unnamed protein product, partial [Choristocarpus tenellus]